MKHNPLFVDSTKFRGDLIRCGFELKNAMVYDEEELFVLITDRNGTREAKMKVLDEQNYEAIVHLPHQALITYQFVVRKDGQKTFQSVIFDGQAQYAVSQEWQPVLEDPAPRPSPAAEPLADEWPRNSVVAVHSLIEKWGF